MKTVIFKAKHGLRDGEHVFRGDKLELDDAQADRLVTLGLADPTDVPSAGPSQSTPRAAAPENPAVTSPAPAENAAAVISPAPADAAPSNAAPAANAATPVVTTVVKKS